MSKNYLFDDESDEEDKTSFKTENEYAKKYDAWREKEEIHKLEQKYGSKALSSEALSTDTEDESDEPPQDSEEMEEDFLKTLAMLKTKDNRIYNPDYKFFDKSEKRKVSKPTTKTLSFADSDDEDEDGGDIFSIEKKAEIEDIHKAEKPTKSTSKDVLIKDFLIGKVEHINNEVEKDLAPLRALWSDPKLNEGEAFLRDYILNKKYLEEGEAGDVGDQVRDDAELDVDEAMVEEQGKFERAYNFRFEEPDEEYLKRFPRTMNYIRPKDDRRSRKRAEVRTRKEEEKKKKMEEISRLKALKLKEIQEKIAKIKEVTGNKELAFREEDIEGEFDPEEHDRRMRAIFDEQYYGQVDSEKPVFPELDQELEIENWEDYNVDEARKVARVDEELHCEDEDFNMDADYDPKQGRANLLEEMKRNLVGKKKRNRKKKSKLAQILADEKPKFVPTIADKTYDDYMEEYYKMDCEDVIGGDLPTRFKYREVVPNDYGLTVEEILLADDKELTQWVPLKRIVKHRPENIEKGEVKTYSQRAADIRLKKKILPSLFKDLPEEPEVVVPLDEVVKKKKKKKKKNKNLITENDLGGEINSELQKKVTNDDAEINHEPVLNVDQDKKKKKKNNKNYVKPESSNEIEVNYLDDNQLKSGKKKKKRQVFPNHGENIGVPMEMKVQVKEHSNKTQNPVKDVLTDNSETLLQDKKLSKKQHKKNEHKVADHADTSVLKRRLDNNNEVSQVPAKKGKTNYNNRLNFKNNKSKNKFKDCNDPLSQLSDERLKAYGLNPKKYRGFLKYKKK